VNERQQAAKEGVETVAVAAEAANTASCTIRPGDTLLIANSQGEDSTQRRESAANGPNAQQLHARDLEVLSPDQLKCIALLADGATRIEAGRVVGVSDGTVSRWANGNESFARELQRVKLALYESTVSLALNTTRQVMAHGEQDRDRVQAAGVVLKHNSDITRAAASATSTVVIDKLINALKGSSSDTIDADYVALAESATPALPE
jgi:hypothetical protein